MAYNKEKNKIITLGIAVELIPIIKKSAKIEDRNVSNYIKSLIMKDLRKKGLWENE